jgi:hypothetical protein
MGGPKTDDVHFLDGAAMDLSQVAERITAEVIREGLRLALVVGAAAAYNFSKVKILIRKQAASVSHAVIGLSGRHCPVPSNEAGGRG